MVIKLFYFGNVEGYAIDDTVYTGWNPLIGNYNYIYVDATLQNYFVPAGELIYNSEGIPVGYRAYVGENMDSLICNRDGQCNHASENY